MGITDPPPNNAGRHLPFAGAAGSGGTGHIDWSDKLVPIPLKKTLEYEHLSFTYDQSTGELIVTDSPGGEEFSFDVAELSELREALVTFGIGISSGSTVNYR
jgi:hypothetical protein